MFTKIKKHQMKKQFLFLLISTVLLISCSKSRLNNNTCGTVTDIDGNTYNTVKIGNQCWTVENLKTTKYNDGTLIPTGLSNTEWKNTTLGACCSYSNSAGNNNTYGKLYNWYAVNTDKLAPVGWHVSTNDDWITLYDNLGSGSEASPKMKATNLWSTPNDNTNSSGFTALPGGQRFQNGTYGLIGSDAFFWTAETYNSYSAWYRSLDSYIGSGGDVGNADNNDGYSIRCVKN